MHRSRHYNFDLFINWWSLNGINLKRLNLNRDGQTQSVSTCSVRPRSVIPPSLRRKIHRLLLEDVVDGGAEPRRRVQDHRRVLDGGAEEALRIRRDHRRPVQHGRPHRPLRALLDHGVPDPGPGHYHRSRRGQALVWGGLARRLSPVYSHARGLFVLVQVGFEGEGLAASATDVRLGVGVGLDVGPEV
jgi:hypothetical protein